jgi:hypothetical protein
MENIDESQPECKYCNDEGYIYTCLNCFKPAINDWEYGVVVCDDCFILGEEQNTISEKCTHCNIADVVVEIPKVGDVYEYPDVEKLNKIINWLYNIKIEFGSSYDLIRPIEVENNKLKYFSNVENIIKVILLSNLKKITVDHRRPSTISWTTSLNGLRLYLKEERNQEMIHNCSYVRLLYPSGCSWDLENINQTDVTNKTHIKESHFVNGVTFNIKDLLNDNFSGFPNLRLSNPECYYRNKEKNILYLIESIKKFELF